MGGMPLFEPTGQSKEELIIKRSRFICEARRIADDQHAREIIGEKRREHPKAAHVVYAFSYGDEKNRQFGMSDDGEPRKSAGRPALEVLRGSDVTNVLITIVRYFGGTKLGTGGLVHAYGEGAKLALEKLPTRELVNEAEGTLLVPYQLLDGAKSALEENGARTLDEAYAETVTIRLRVGAERRERLEKALRDASRGILEVEWA
ncbi:MAG: IMPACT family protein [Alkalispirochaetaceae bacterium]